MTKLAFDYFPVPENESCYGYLKKCYENISADAGEYGAFVTNGCETSMKDFLCDVEKLAAYLDGTGLKKGDVVTVFLPNCANAFTAFYALSKLGIIGAFVHPLTPPAALRGLLEFTCSKAVFILDRAFKPYEEVLEEYKTVVCSLSDYATGKVKEYLLADEAAVCSVPQKENIIKYSDAIDMNLPFVADGEFSSRETALYLHGSGTTGKSKTVKLSSFALNQVAKKQAYIDRYHEFGKSYSLCVLPLFHAFGVGASLHYCMCNSYTPVIMTKFDPVKANEIIASYNIQYIAGAPGMFVKMYEADNFINPGLKNLTCLYSGGDIVSEAFIGKFNATLAQQGSRGKLFRGWGLTEMCAVCATNSHIAYKADSIGPASYGLKVAVFDEDSNPLPPNTNGEIALSGETIMNGYLPDSDIEESGIYTDENGRDWIKTGDMGYVDEEGFIFFTGRKKRIIIISGYNVYPYSIEQKVSELDFINEVCAVQGYSEEKKPVVKLCISLKAGKDENDAEKEILEFCRENLNGFSVPRKIEFLAQLPRTKMDKLDFMTMSDAIPR